MEDKQILEYASQYIKTIDVNFQKCRRSSIDDMKFQENLTSILNQLSTSTQPDNHVLIALEKFYQSSSLLIGLSTLALDEKTYQAWREYDAFHFESVKPALKLYGPSVVL